MIFATPDIATDLRDRLDELDRLRQELGDQVEQLTSWMGTLRRAVRASSIESSTSIEGYSVEPAEAIALTSGDAPGESEDENRLAVACYARAMDHVAALARDVDFHWLDRVILDLHFDACHFQRDKSPGLWRTGPISVTGPGGGIDYRGPDGERVPSLMAEVVSWLERADDLHPVVRGAMAHLDVISVHPFRDGNGRVARIVQSLVLAREGLLSPEFSSIEEHLSRNTPAYYAALRDTQGGSYQPDRDASAWVRFCIEAHVSQANQRLGQVREAAERWERLEREAEDRGWPDRFVIALEQSLIGGADRAGYGKEAGVSPATVTADLRRLLDSGLVEQRGRGPGTRFWASAQLRSLLSG
ncbi:MAG TPA: Fic family protein [Solirubrobacterales bacterium]|nr:Fic family protein [Solirubrobacterales bacterium]